MHVLRKLTAVAVVVAAAACSDSTGSNSTTLTQAEQLALVNALVATGSDIGALAVFVIGHVDQIGSLQAGSASAARINQTLDQAIRTALTSAVATEYEGAVGVAVQVNYTDPQQSFSGWFYGVVGWNGINATAGTVDELVVVGGEGEGTSLPGSVSSTVESGEVTALYRSGGTTHDGTSGHAAVTGSAFGSGTDCSASGPGYEITACNVAAGTMNGDFDFAGNGYTQPAVQFTSLPAVRMTFDVTINPAR